MKLSSAIENYVALKRSLGAVFSVDAGILRSFSRALGDVCLEAITAEDCRTFCRGKGLPTRFWERKHESPRGFFRYLVSRGILVNSPFQDPAPRIQRTFRPHIYSHDELRRLLEAAAQERNPRTRLEPETLRTIILLLYGAGLRAGEALRLRPCDVNLQDRVLSIWNTKFFKSRLIPIGAGLAAVLARYAQQRQPVRPPDEHPPASFRPVPGCQFSFGRSRSDLRVCGSEPGFDELPRTAGTLDFMIFGRRLRFTVWSPGIVRAQTFRHVYPCWPLTWDT